MTWTTADSAHPVLRCADTVLAAVREVDRVDPAFMTTTQKRTALLELARARDQVEAVWLRVLDSAGDLAGLTGERDAAAWLAAHARMDRGTASGAQRLAGGLAHTWQATGAAVQSGEVAVAQARVIIRCLDDLASVGTDSRGVPDGQGEPVSAEVLGLAEARLIELAALHSPGELRTLGGKILSTVAPEVADETERRRLEAAERRAGAATRLTMRRRGDGSTDVHARIPEALATRLKTYLDAFTAPRTAAGPRWTPGRGIVDPATGIKLPFDRVQGQAFCALLECLPAEVMPLHGGSATSLVVTVDLETLRTGLGEATTLGAPADTSRITAGEARRLACQATIIPAVLGTDSEVFDLGRSSRLFTRGQRLKAALEHPTCRTVGCSVPATMCEAHHGRDPWGRGGTTDQADLTHLCPWHHHRAHDPAYLTKRLANGDVRFHRRR
ncbi:HNH endonuclease signature motif containing protein [Nocardioides campestrisoli]|uniref:HNH endonuclease signature motif containing protein n=1 Tax=Nocardioides campestrisoli TaxID=2736757 RepID=UPI0015E680C6|nr:HNH endonuclease signature motif containing protein [Nocardioides campestrisoli]